MPNEKIIYKIIGYLKFEYPQSQYPKIIYINCMLTRALRRQMRAGKKFTLISAFSAAKK